MRSNFRSYSLSNLINSSETERAALNAGTGKYTMIHLLSYSTNSHLSSCLVGFDRNIFNGNPSLADLKDYSVKLSPEEKGKCDQYVM